MYEDGIDGDSLKEVIDCAIKRIDIGTAVLPEPLFKSDVDESDEQETLNNSSDDKSTSNSILSGNSTNYNTYKSQANNTREDREGRAPDHCSVTQALPSTYARTLRNEFNAIVVEHHLKWAPMCVSEPGPFDDGSPSLRLGRYDFHHADAIVDWAVKHNMKVKGHVLVWHVTSYVPSESLLLCVLCTRMAPCCHKVVTLFTHSLLSLLLVTNASTCRPKLLEELSPEDVREQLKRHIFTTMGHFRDRIKVWDVVNEALAPDGKSIVWHRLGVV